MIQERSREHLRILGAGLALVILLFSRGCVGRVPSPTDLIFQWYPWTEVKPAGYERPRNPQLYDGAAQVYPWFLFARDEIRSGRLPLWNPYAAGGLPHAANPITAVFSPFSIPLWILPLSLALILIHAAKVFLGWTFMAYYLRHRGFGRYETFLGAAAFALCGYVILWLFWRHGETFIWLPLLFLFSERVMDRRQPRDLVLLGIVGGLCTLSGHVETTFHNGVALAAWCGGRLGWGLIRRRTRPPEAAGAVVRLLIAAIIGVAISAVVLVPFLEYLGESHSLQQRATLETNPFYLKPSRALALVAPHFFGNPVRGENWYPGGMYIEAGQGYFGVVPFALFLLGIALAVRRRDPSGIGLAAIGIGSLLVAYGIPPFFQWVTSLPGFRLSLNFRMLSLTIFAGVVLGAGALQTILRGRREDRGDLVIAAIFAGAGIAFLLVVLPFLAVRRPGDLVPGALDSPIWIPGPPRWMALHLVLAAGLAGGFFLLLGLKLAGRLSNARFRWIVAAMVIGDLVWFAFPFNPMIPPDQIYPPTAATDFLARTDGPPFRALGTRTYLPVGTNLPYRIQDIRGYDAMGIARYERLREALAGGASAFEQGEIRSRALLDFLNVRYIVRGLPPDRPGAWPVVNERPAEEILPSSPLGQTFQAPANGLYGVAFQVGTYRRINRGTLRFRLLEDGPGGAERAVQEVEMADLEDNRWRLFSFPPIADSAGKRYYAYLESPGASAGNAVTVWISRPVALPQGALHRSHVPFPGQNLCIQVFSEAGDKGIRRMQGLSIDENLQALPRAFLVRDVAMAGSEEESLRWILEGKVDLASTVILEELLPSPGDIEALTDPLPEGSPEGSVEIISYLSGEARIRIESNPAAAVLVMSDTFYPGWRAYIDDDAAPILRANHAFRAVAIPAGSHDLVFRYVSPTTRWGGAISVAAILLVACLLVWMRPAGGTDGAEKSSEPTQASGSSPAESPPQPDEPPRDDQAPDEPPTG